MTAVILWRKRSSVPNLPTTRRYHELLENKEIDCIVAAVPDHWHKQVVVDAVSAGKDIYIEKPMSHTGAEGVEMVEAAKKNGRIVQVGSQRVSSVICAKAKELVAQGVLGDLTLVEGSLGRNDPTGAWEYPPPHRSLAADARLGYLARNCAQAGLRSPDFCALALLEGIWHRRGRRSAGSPGERNAIRARASTKRPKQAMAMGGILRWKDGRNMPDVHCTLFKYGEVPVYMRLNLGTETPETYRFQGSKGILELTEYSRHLHSAGGR